MKKIIISIVLLIVALISAIVYFSGKTTDENTISGSPSPSVTEESSLPSPSFSPKSNITKVPVPLPSGDGRTTFIDETVPWSLLLTDASCELRGELKFLNRNTYDNQNAVFIYKGIDHPGRNIFWTVIPQDNLSIGPNIFNRTPIPDGESLLGVVLPENPQYKKYEITAKIQYGRLVDANGNFVTVGGYVKVFEKQCNGRTTVVLP